MENDDKEKKSVEKIPDPDADIAAALQQQFLAEFSGIQSANPGAVSENEVNMAKSLIEALAQRTFFCFIHF